jgi:hypothetical protein
MFLWVRLVLDSLEDDVFNANELRAAVDALPIGLTELYVHALYAHSWTQFLLKTQAMNESYPG